MARANNQGGYVTHEGKPPHRQPRDRPRVNPRPPHSQGGLPNEGVPGDVPTEELSPFKTWWRENKATILASYPDKVDKDRVRKFARAAWHLRSLLPPIAPGEVPEEEVLSDEDLLGVIPVQAPPTQSFLGGFDVEELNQFSLGDVAQQMLQARQNKMAAESDYFGVDELMGGEE